MAEAFRLLAAGYLIVLAAAAVAGRHSLLLRYPARVGYAAARLIVLCGTLGRVRMSPIARSAKYTSRRKFAGVRARLERLRSSGDELTAADTEIRWESAEGSAQTAAASARVPEVAPPPPPASAPPAAPPASATAPVPPGTLPSYDPLGERDDSPQAPKLY